MKQALFLITNISTHSPTRGLTLTYRKPAFQRIHFNSQPHKGADERRKDFVFVVGISTHSPTRGLTPCRCILCNFLNISTHSPTRGLTIVPKTMVASSTISTHSPTRGLTVFIKNYSPQVLFQLTAPQGG